MLLFKESVEICDCKMESARLQLLVIGNVVKPVDQDDSMSLNNKLLMLSVKWSDLLHLLQFLIIVVGNETTYFFLFAAKKGVLQGLHSRNTLGWINLEKFA